ncbi:Abi family protein [Erysipelothrix anatis]|uniref:Abi family protein n=1 Tax=Erysipelothrix anatis TaxID=2683713 RepID=UPI0013593677|nr:Abi family protein [Erysipelothrix anatis]
MKPFLTISEQITLIDSRGMEILSNPKAYEFLLRKNYFNTVTVYGKLFSESNDKDRYIVGSNFNEIMQAYYFDKDIREITLKMSLEVEANVRSTIAYYFSEKFPEPNSYLDINNYRKNFVNEYDKDRFLNTFVYFQRELDKFFKRGYKPGRKLGTPIEHYMNKYQHIPLWVFINEFSAGDLCTFFELLDYQLQEDIAKCFSNYLSSDYGQPIIFKRYELLNFLESIRDLRNRAAHDNCLVYFKPKESVKYHVFLHPQHGLSKRDTRQSYFHTMITMQMFLNKSNFLYFQKAIAKKIRNISKSVPSIDVNSLTDTLGFPYDWHLQEHLLNKPPKKRESNSK